MNDVLKNETIGMKSNKIFYLTFVSLILFQLSWHFYLWAKGFNAFTTDEYLRLYFSASWAKYPKLFIPGEFLPFFFYLYGTFIKLTGNIVWAGRILTLLFSLIFTVSFYSICYELTKNRFYAVLAVLLVFSSSVFMKVSTVPLSEIGALAMLSSSILYLFKWHENLKNTEANGKSHHQLIVSSMLLFIANGLRYESWLVTAVIAFFVFCVCIKHRFSFKDLLSTVLILFVPLMLPLLWLIVGKIYFSDATKFIPRIVQDTGINIWDSFLYPKLLLVHYPFHILLLIPSIFFVKTILKDSKRTLFILLSIVFFIFLGYIGLRYTKSHMIMPQRTLLFLIFSITPLIALALKHISEKMVKTGKTLSIFVFVTATALCIFSFVKFTDLPKPPLASAREVGIYLKNLSAKEKENENTVLVEKSGWDWCAIYVESNLMQKIFWDRKSILGKKMAAMPSELSSMSVKYLKEIAKENRIARFVFKDPELIKFIKESMKILNVKHIDKYTVLTVDYDF